MKVYRTKRWVTKYLEGLRSAGKTIGFVPTMGALHEGHLSLLRQASAVCDVTVVSIFVNPIQFNNPEDLRAYPRDESSDLKLLNEAGCSVAFIPSVSEMYPGPVTEEYDFGHLELVMEGQYRPGHFRGVAVVVKRLFDIVMPDKAFFGLKDFQQLVIIRELVKKTGQPVDIVACETVREADGLAMSSRNRRLTPLQRERAPFIYKTLVEAREAVSYLTPTEVKHMITTELEKLEGFRLEYIEIADENTLLPVKEWKVSEHCRACIAIYAGEVRLIDNLRVF